ncbi:hypothetical protein D3C77_797790 [compost metagenome]
MDGDWYGWRRSCGHAVLWRIEGLEAYRVHLDGAGRGGWLKIDILDAGKILGTG